MDEQQLKSKISVMCPNCKILIFEEIFFSSCVFPIQIALSGTFGTQSYFRRMHKADKIIAWWLFWPYSSYIPVFGLLDMEELFMLV